MTEQEKTIANLTDKEWADLFWNALLFGDDTLKPTEED